ncbi:hypothetical protein ACFL5V_11280 [Fibrobacterota bacterium]
MISFLIITFLFGRFLLQARKSELSFFNFEKLLLIWLSFGVISFISNFRFGLNTKVAYALVFAMIWQFAWVLTYFGIRTIDFSKEQFKRILTIGLSLGIVLNGFAIIERIFYKYIQLFLINFSKNEFIQANMSLVFNRGYGIGAASYRCVSFVLEFVTYGYVAGFFSIAFLVLFFSHKKKFFLLGLCISICALFLTQTLSAIFSFFIITAVYFIIFNRLDFRKLFFIASFSLCMLIYSIYSNEQNLFSGTFKRISDFSHGKDPGQLFHINKFKFSPIDNISFWGNGLGTGDFLHTHIKKEMLKRNYVDVEHQYWRILLEFGAFGLTLFILILFFLMKLLLGIFYSTSDKWLKSIILIELFWVMQNIIVGFFHRSFPSFSSSIFPSIILAIAIQTINKANSDPVPA